jgi:hypothetical protein
MYTTIYTLTIKSYGYTFCPIIDDWFRDTDIINSDILSFTSYDEFKKACHTLKNVLNNPERNIVDYDISTSFLDADALTFINDLM